MSVSSKQSTSKSVDEGCNDARMRLTYQYFGEFVRTRKIELRILLSEMLQNSIDAGAKLVQTSVLGVPLDPQSEFAIKTRDAGLPPLYARRILECKDWGCGMSYEAFNQLFMTLGMPHVGGDDGTQYGQYGHGKTVVFGCACEVVISSCWRNEPDGEFNYMIALISQSYNKRTAQLDGDDMRVPVVTFTETELGGGLFPLLTTKSKKFQLLSQIATHVHGALRFAEAVPLTGVTDCGYLGEHDDSHLDYPKRVVADEEPLAIAKPFVRMQIGDFVRARLAGYGSFAEAGQPYATGTAVRMTALSTPLIAITRPDDTDVPRSVFNYVAKRGAQHNLSIPEFQCDARGCTEDGAPAPLMQDIVVSRKYFLHKYFTREMIRGPHQLHQLVYEKNGCVRSDGADAGTYCSPTLLRDNTWIVINAQRSVAKIYRNSFSTMPCTIRIHDQSISVYNGDARDDEVFRGFLTQFKKQHGCVSMADLNHPASLKFPLLDTRRFAVRLVAGEIKLSAQYMASFLECGFMVYRNNALVLPLQWLSDNQLTLLNRQVQSKNKMKAATSVRVAVMIDVRAPRGSPERALFDLNLDKNEFVESEHVFDLITAPIIALMKQTVDAVVAREARERQAQAPMAPPAPMKELSEKKRAGANPSALAAAALVSLAEQQRARKAPNRLRYEESGGAVTRKPLAKAKVNKKRSAPPVAPAESSDSEETVAGVDESVLHCVLCKAALHSDAIGLPSLYCNLARESLVVCGAADCEQKFADKRRRTVAKIDHARALVTAATDQFLNYLNRIETIASRAPALQQRASSSSSSSSSSAATSTTSNRWSAVRATVKKERFD